MPGNLENLSDVDEKPNYTFVKGDILDEAFVEETFIKLFHQPQSFIWQQNLT